MKILWKALVASSLALPGLAMAANDLSCGSVNFGAEVLAKFPNAKAACRGVQEKDGTVYVRYVADVVATTKDSMTVVFKDQDNKGVSKVTLAPTANDSLTVGGKSSKFMDLRKGDTIDMWVPHSRWGLYGTPGGPKMTVVSQETLKKE
jgi:hypothetical protein